MFGDYPILFLLPRYEKGARQFQGQCPIPINEFGFHD
jgi:hypothetical protein